MVEFPHGYTYSAHPVACAAGLAALDVLEREQLPQRVKAMSGYFEQAVHQLKGAPYVEDIRTTDLQRVSVCNTVPESPCADHLSWV